MRSLVPVTLPEEFLRMIVRANALFYGYIPSVLHTIVGKFNDIPNALHKMCVLIPADPVK